MPTYIYECGGCGGFEAVRPLAEFDRAVACPSCGGLAPRALTVPQVAVGAVEAVAGPSHRSGCACCRPSPFRGKLTAS